MELLITMKIINSMKMISTAKDQVILQYFCYQIRYIRFPFNTKITDIWCRFIFNLKIT